ncbi:MAG: homoserine dehydrogenase [Fidelibacterota bacterium]
MTHKLALIGFGTVGQGLTRILRDRRTQLQKDHDFEFEILAVSDFLKGSVYCEAGLDLDHLLELVQSGISLSRYSRGRGPCHTGWDALKTIRESDATIVCELTYTDIRTGEPATTHIKEALSSGKHVATSNKGPPALAYAELSRLAERSGVQFFMEGTVMSGTPVLSLATQHLAGSTVSAISGILNGTTNFILTEMEKGIRYDETLKKAQELGYAEADPTSDVEGLDALAKVAILANVIMGENLRPEDIPVQGISQLTLEKIEAAKSEGKRWKLLGEVRKAGGKVEASVAPQKVDLSHPLADISGPTNAITFTTEFLGEVTVIGPGAGKEATGFAVLSDLLEIHRRST